MYKDASAEDLIEKVIDLIRRAATLDRSMIFIKKYLQIDFFLSFRSFN